MLNIQDYYEKLAANESLSETDIVALLKELTHFRLATAFLASAQAATLEALPKSTGKSARHRHVNLSVTAADLLGGDASRVQFPVRWEDARDRCHQAVEKSHQT